MRHQVMTNQTWRLALAASAFLSVAVAVAWDASGRIEALWPVRNVIAPEVPPRFAIGWMAFVPSVPPPI